MLSILRKITPRFIIGWYHLALAIAAAFWYGHPSRKLTVIGVTGTNGKSSTVQFIAQLLERLDARVGYTTTAGFCIAGESIKNDLKMTMPGRFFLQDMIQKMVNAKCEYAIVETTSQGIAQHRHRGIDYDLAVLTNLTPEHIESHGGFEAYRRAKGKLFAGLTKTYRKGDQEKISIINADDEHAKFFLSFPADTKVQFGCKNTKGKNVIKAVESTKAGKTIFTIGTVSMSIPLAAGFQRKNALAAIATVHALGYSLKRIATATKALRPIPGRFELVDAGQPFDVIIDYSYEPVGIQALLDTVKERGAKQIIGIHSSTGGGRDISRRFTVGELAAKQEDIVIITNEDPYDEDPLAIMEDVAKGAKKGGKTLEKDLFIIEDRAEAIAFAITKAKKGAAVLLTAKGNEPVMALAKGKKVPWSDKQAALDGLAKRGYGRK